MTQTYPYLVITDGATTCTFWDGTGATSDYEIVERGWSPAVAGLRRSPLGGRGPYDDVTESMEVAVHGASWSAAMTNIATLRRLMEQAERFSRGENVAPVLIKWVPQGSNFASVGAVSASASVSPSGSQSRSPSASSSPSPSGSRSPSASASPSASVSASPSASLSGSPSASVSASPSAAPTSAGPFRAAILGGRVDLLPRWADDPATFWTPIRLTFVRRGEWLLGEDGAASSATTNGEIATLNLPSALNDPGPTRLRLTNYVNGLLGAFIALTTVQKDLVILAANGGASGVYTSVNDAAQNARNTNVLRYTPGVTTEVFSGNITLAAAALTTTCTLAAVYANVRNNSATTTFQMRVRAFGLRDAYTPHITIAAGQTHPRWYFCGLVPVNVVSGATLITVGLTASAAADTLDIDSLVLANVNNPETQVIAMGAMASGLSVSIDTLDVDHKLLSAAAPAATFATIYPSSYSGDLCLHTKGATLYGLLLGTSGSAPGFMWRQWSTTVQINTWTAYRRPGYLVPM